MRIKFSILGNVIGKLIESMLKSLQVVRDNFFALSSN